MAGLVQQVICGAPLSPGADCYHDKLVSSVAVHGSMGGRPANGARWSGRQIGGVAGEREVNEWEEKSKGGNEWGKNR